MTAPTPAEVEALAVVISSPKLAGPMAVISWGELAERILAAGYRLPSRDDMLREKVEALAKEVDVYYPIKFQFGAEANYIAGYTDMRSRLRALLAEVEPQPEPEGERCRHGEPEDACASCAACAACRGECGVCPYLDSDPIAAPVPSPVAAEERTCDGSAICLASTHMEHCRSLQTWAQMADDAAPEPVAAAPDEEREAALKWFSDEEWHRYQRIPDQGYSHRHWLNHHFNGKLAAAGYLPPAEVARVVAEAKAEALDEFGDFIATPKHPGLDGPTLYQVYLEAHARADDLRAALVGGPDETGGES